MTAVADLPLWAPRAPAPPRKQPEGSAVAAISAPCATADPDGLRPYQREAVTAIGERLSSHRSTLLVMATGLGKTVTFSAVAKHWPGRVLVLAHRKELIEAARKKLRELTGEPVGIEKAERHSSGQRIVVGSVQTLHEQRIKYLPGEKFGLVIVDEAHHAVAQTYRTILDAYPQAQVLGATATPDRGDKKAMGRVFDSALPMSWDMDWGIREAWLSPLTIRPVRADVHLEKVNVKAGEFARGQLDDAISEVAAQISRATMELAGRDRTLVFGPGVKTAHAAAEAMNLVEPGSAFCIDGKTDDFTRETILRRHRDGEFPRLANCMVFTEGYDDPQLLALLLAIVCKTRGRLAQIIGRLSRLWPGIDKLVTAEERRAAIAASPKPAGRVFNLVPENQAVNLASPVDVLGGNYTDEERERAKKTVDNEGGDVVEALNNARAEIAAAAARAAKLKVLITAGEPFDAFKASGIRDREAYNKFGNKNPGKPPSEPMRWRLINRMGFTAAEADGINFGEANKLITQDKAWEADGRAGMSQRRKLYAKGLPHDLTRQQAADLLWACQQSRTGIASRGDVERIVAGRVPGEEC